MSGNSLQIILLLLSTLSLCGLGFSGMLVSRAQRDRRRLAERVNFVTTPYQRMPRIVISAFTRQAAKQNRSVAAILARIFAVNPARLDIYPLKWWLALLVTLVIANFGRLVVRMLTGNTPALVLMPLLWVFLSRSFFDWAEGRQRDRMLNQFPDALAMIVRSVRVGIPVMEALGGVARESPEPTRTEFDRVAKEVAVGGTLEDAILEMATRVGLPEYRFFATALSLQNQTGGALSETLESLADVIRKRMALKAKGYAMTSEARTSTLVLAALPAVIGSAMYLINPSYIMVLFINPTGNKMLGGAAISLTVGLMSIRMIIRKTLP